MQLSGHLNNRVTLLRPVVTRSPLGEQVTTWEKDGEYWASVTANPGTRTADTGEIFLTGGVKVRMRYHPRASERMRLWHDGEVYAINNLHKSRIDDVTTFTAVRLPDSEPYDFHESELWHESDEWHPEPSNP